MSVEHAKPWSATVVDTAASNPYFSVRTQDVTVTDGSKRVYHTIHFPNAAVGIVARRDTDFLLIRQYRFIIDQYVWAIPSGGVADGESLEAAALRELQEETGHVAAAVRPLLTCYASYGCSDQRFEIFLADDIHMADTPIDDNEVIEARWFTRNEVWDLIERNGIVDNLSLSPILLVLLRDSATVPSRTSRR
jgi:8-oxo-dGTP pyrophosphatase MutT (NUDIX family)